MSFVKYLNPKTKEEIMTNLVYLLRENEKMEGIELFQLDGSLDCSKSTEVSWTFLKSILEDLNEFVRQKWIEKQLPKNTKEIEELELMLKKNELDKR